MRDWRLVRLPAPIHPFDHLEIAKHSVDQSISQWAMQETGKLKEMTVARAVEIRGQLERDYRDVFTPEALSALDALTAFDDERKAVMRARIARRAQRFDHKRRIEFLEPDSIIPRTRGRTEFRPWTVRMMSKLFPVIFPTKGSRLRSNSEILAGPIASFSRARARAGSSEVSIVNRLKGKTFIESSLPAASRASRTPSPCAEGTDDRQPQHRDREVVAVSLAEGARPGREPRLAR